MEADEFDIAKSFKDLDLLKALAPIANVLDGKLNSTINLQGTLNESFSPDLQSVSGDALAELLTTDFSSENNNILNALEGKLSFVDFDKLDLSDLKTSLTFKDGGVTVKPFNLKYEDIDINISGNHGFDKTIDYNVMFNVPAKYLGSEVNRLIGQINDPEVNKITIPVTANILGSFNNPKVNTDLSSGISNLMGQLVEIQKQKLLNQGGDAINDILGGIMSGNNESSNDTTNNPQDSTITNAPNTGETIKNILGGILNKNKQKKDTVN